MSTTTSTSAEPAGPAGPTSSASPTGQTGQTGATHTVDLLVGGMTCASCAARIEKKLNRLDGVNATVNFATEKARVTFPAAQVSAADLIRTIEATGYTAELPTPPATAPTGAAGRSGTPAVGAPAAA